MNFEPSDITQNAIGFAYRATTSRETMVGLVGDFYVIRSRVTMPTFGDPAPVHFVATTFVRWRPEAYAALADFTLGWTAPIQKDVMNDAVLGEYMSGTIIKERVVADNLRSRVEMTAGLATMIAPHLVRKLERFDTSGLWTVGYLVLFQLLDRAAAGVVYVDVPGANALDVVTMINLTPAENAVQASANAFFTALVNGHFVILRKLLSDVDVSAVRLLSVGPRRLGPVEEGRHHVSSQILTPRIPFAILQNAAAALPAQQVLTAGQFYASMMKIAHILNAGTDLVKGFIRAATYYNGTLHIHDAPIFINAMLEVNASNMPRPMGHNPIFNMLGLEAAPRNEAWLQADLDTLLGIGAARLPPVAALIAATLSLGASSVFHENNVTGRELNSLGGLVGVQMNAVPTILACINSNDRGHSPIYDIACGFAPQITPMVVNNSTYRGCEWSAAVRNIQDAHWAANRSWQGAFGPRIPMVTNPLSLSNILTSFSHLWGFSGPGIRYNLSGACIKGGGDARGIYAGKGDKEYARVLGSQNPTEYVPYGAIMINMIAQNSRFIAAPVVAYETWAVCDNEGIKLNVHEGDPVHGYVANLFYIPAGTIVTWNWDQMLQTRPFLQRNQLPAGIFDQYAPDALIPSLNAGLQPGAPLARSSVPPTVLLPHLRFTGAYQHGNDVVLNEQDTSLPPGGN